MSYGPLLSARNLGKSFGAVKALDNVSFELRAGEVHALCGENGAGKSTLIKVLSGVWPHGSYEGQVFLDGRESRFQSVRDAETAGIAVIYQELALVNEMTVAENLFLGEEPTRAGFVNWDRLHSEAAALLGRMGIDIPTTAVVGDLGAGKQQLVEIAKALRRQSRILLLDEPTAALTETEVAKLLQIVRELRDKGVTCFYITHKLDEMFAIADRITVLRDGRSVASLRKADTDKGQVIQHMVGREVRDHYPRRSAAPGNVALEVDDICVADEATGRPVLDGICFNVRCGEVLGIGGLMGAGRSELLLHLFGAFGVRTAGDVRVAGRPLVARHPADAIAAGLMLVSEDRKRYGLHLEMDVGFNLSLAQLRAFVRSGIIDRNAEFAANQKFFDRLRIKAPNQETQVANLSGGNQQKVVIGKALMTEPAVVLLDEPTRGIDVGAKQEVYELVNSLTSEGKAVVLVSSDMPELMGMSDRVVVLSEGRVGGRFDDRGKATQQELLYAGMAHHGWKGAAR
jgi:D-xylose transport system ATP-binding protein